MEFDVVDIGTTKARLVATGRAARLAAALGVAADEDRAKAVKIGIWAGELQNPSEFRHRYRRGNATCGAPRLYLSGQYGPCRPAMQ